MLFLRNGLSIHLIPRPKKSKRNQDHVSTKDKYKRGCGFAVSILYGAGAVFMVLLVGLSVDQSVADMIFITFLIQIAHDIFLNQPLLVLFNYFLLMMLKNPKYAGCKKIILMIINANVVTSFI